MNRYVYRTAAALLSAVLLFPIPARGVSARRAVLLDAATGRVLYEKDGYSQGLIASTTKIMTALVVCEQCNVLDRVKIPKEAVGIEGSSLYLQAGEVLTVQELLYGLMLHSGNDAAVALAIYCGGTVEGFVEMMNDKAHVLGLKSTHFANPNGLDSPGHYSTAYDLAILTAYAMENPIFRQTVSTKTITIGSRSLRNHNKLLWLVEGADGVKTGFTRAAGRILVSSATREGRRLVAVTMDDPNDWDDHTRLLSDGFARYETRQLVAAGEQVDVMAVLGGVESMVPVVAEEDFFYPLAKDEQVSYRISPPGFAFAPISQGETAGRVYVCVDGKAVGSVPLCFGQTVERQKEPEPGFWQRFFRKTG